jgi:hypothetical protein
MFTFSWKENKDGSVTVSGPVHKVRLSAAEVRASKMWAQLGKEPWAGPQASQCPLCSEMSLFEIKSQPRGPEVVVITFKCAACGQEDYDVMD